MTPRTDREVYRVQKCDIGFSVVNPALARDLENRYNAALRALILARERIKGFEGFARSVNEALNSGDGSYRP